MFGSDLILEKMVAEVGEEIDRMNILFSGIPFPGSEHCLEFVREETKERKEHRNVGNSI